MLTTQERKDLTARQIERAYRIGWAKGAESVVVKYRAAKRPGSRMKKAGPWILVVWGLAMGFIAGAWAGRAWF